MSSWESNLLKQPSWQEIKESSKFGNYGPP